MYRIGIMERSVEQGTDIEQLALEYARKMRLEFEICRWKFEDELTADLDAGNVPDVLFLPVGEENKKKESTGIAGMSIWKQRIDGRTREAKLHGKPKDRQNEELRTGIALAKKLREREDCERMQLVFIAPQKAFYEGLIQTRPLDLLLEPLTRERVHEVLRRTVPIVKDKEKRLTFQRGRNSYFLPFQDILYVCSDKRRILIKAVRGEFEFNGRLKDVILKLPEEFLAIHRSYIINKNHVLRYEYEYLEMMDGTVFSISRPNRKMVRRILLDR